MKKQTKCKHKNTTAIFDPLNTYYGISYECMDCGKIMRGDDSLEGEVSKKPSPKGKNAQAFQEAMKVVRKVKEEK